MNAPANPVDWDRAAREGDPLADRTIAAIVGPWSEMSGADAPGATRLAQATRLMGEWTTNASLAAWTAPEGTDPQVAQALRSYLDEGAQLPPWMNAARIETAENIFMEYGPTSCVLLFCASLPECYVLPHLAEVLHIAGQLEAHTEYRIRQTAAMVFPVMMKGGLGTPGGGGVAQVLKVRLIHATIRHLILHGSPESVSGRVERQALTNAAANMNQALCAHGWDVARNGVPCSQLELAYTLLTFSFVFLDGMRSLGMPLSPSQEEAFLHAWNVAGHVLGIRDEYMAHTMREAQGLFDRLQAQARALPADPEVRPPLGQALLNTMAKSIRIPVIRHIPVPMTRWLIGNRAAGEIGANERVGLLTRALFAAGRVAVRIVDDIVREVLPTFSLSRMFTRVIGYHLLTKFLLDQTRPLTLPQAVLDPMTDTIAGWHHDRHAPAWVNELEDKLTTRGEWRPHR